MTAMWEERNNRINVKNPDSTRSPSLFQRSSDLIIAEHSEQMVEPGYRCKAAVGIPILELPLSEVSLLGHGC